MQIAVYTEDIEIPLAQESHSYDHLVSPSKGNSAGRGCAELGRGKEDVIFTSTASPGPAEVMPWFSLQTAPLETSHRLLGRNVQRVPHQNIAKERRCRGGSSSSSGRVGSGEASAQSSLLPHSPPTMLRM